MQSEDGSRTGAGRGRQRLLGSERASQSSAPNLRPPGTVKCVLPHGLVPSPPSRQWPPDERASQRCYCSPSARSTSTGLALTELLAA